MASLGGSPTIGLVYTLTGIFSAILLGFLCCRTEKIVPGRGDMRALGFFVGKVAFPLLIFNTIATAQLGGIDFGVVLACGLAKFAIYWSVLCLTYCLYRSSQRKGQRLLTATVFAFFSIASDDFATGFPVIDALYGQPKTVYIAANSLVGSFIMVPMTLVMFEIGNGLEHGAEDSTEDHEALRISRRQILSNILLNPVIVMTVLGLLFQVSLGGFLATDPATGSKQLPEPLRQVVKLWTGPFGMLALFSTGVSLKVSGVSFWPGLLVALKLVVCAYLSYAFALVLVYQEPKGELHDFAFFYGAIPTSSAPLVFAQQYDPGSVQLIASAILFGYILAGPNMFVTALFLARETTDMTTLLTDVQNFMGVASSVCSGVFIIFMVMSHRSWRWSGKLLTIYAAFVLCYGAFDAHLASEHHDRDRRVEWSERVFFNFLQKTCAILVLYMQLLQTAGWPGGWHSRWCACLPCVAMAAALAPLTRPAAFDQLVHLTPELGTASVLESFGLLAAVLCLAAWGVARKSASRRLAAESGRQPPAIEVARAQALAEEVAAEQSDVASSAAHEAPAMEPEHPAGVAKALCMLQGVRALTQVVNTIALSVNPDAGVRGGLVQMLIIEQMLEAGQGVFLLVATLLQERSGYHLRACAELISSMFERCGWRDVAETHDVFEGGAEEMPFLIPRLSMSSETAYSTRMSRTSISSWPGHAGAPSAGRARMTVAGSPAVAPANLSMRLVRSHSDN